MKRDWPQFFRQLASRAVNGLVTFPLLLSVIFVAVDLGRGASWSWELVGLTTLSTFVISWTIFVFVSGGLAVTYRFDMWRQAPNKSSLYAGMALLAMAGLTLGLPLASFVLNRCCGVPWGLDRSYIAGSLFTGGLITAALLFLYAFRASQRRVAELEHVTVEARYETLKAQLQPHFLFNSLNSLAELIDTASPEAGRMTERLADLYRTILTNSKEKTATIESELAIVENYLSLERLRFGARLQFSIECPVELRRRHVPSLLLQTLVENAVKHGISPAIDGGFVDITIRRADRPLGWLAVEVANSGAPIRKGGAVGAKGTGTGIANAQERLTLMYGADHSFSFGDIGGGRTVVSFKASGASLD